MTTTHTALGYTSPLPVSDPSAIVERAVPTPTPGPGDLLVAVEAVSVNPVDVKTRASSASDDLRILGFDAAGTVVAVGDEVDGFAEGDEVFYAGSIDRPGSDQRFQLVQARLVGRKPTSISSAEAASLPLTALTAWEAVFDRLGITAKTTGTLLVVGASGGVGSILLQLVTALAPGVRLVATASSDEARDWVTGFGASATVDHHAGDLPALVKDVAPEGVDWIFTAHSEGQEADYAEILKPGGAVVAIDDGPREISALKSKSQSWHWELMFTDALHRPGSTHQREILDRVAALVDAGRIRPTVARTLTPLTAETLIEAHRLVEDGHVIGKVVLHGWE